MLTLVKSAPKEPQKVPYETFYEENYGKAVQYIRNKIGSHEDAEDLAGEVFLYCYTHYDGYDPERSSLTTWLYMIINSRIKNHYRDAKTYVDLESVVGVLPDEGPDLDAGIRMEEIHTGVMAAINQLPERRRQIVMMSYFENLSSAEIGQRLGLTPGNVRVQLSRALDSLETLCRDFM